MLKARLVTAAALLPPVVAAVWLGGGVLAVLLAAVGLLAGWEAAGLLLGAVAPPTAAPAWPGAAAGKRGARAAAGRATGGSAGGPPGIAGHGRGPGGQGDVRAVGERDGGTIGAEGGQGQAVPRPGSPRGRREPGATGGGGARTLARGEPGRRGAAAAGRVEAAREGWLRLRAACGAAGILPVGALALLPWPPAAAMAAAPLAAAVLGAVAAPSTAPGAPARGAGGPEAGPLKAAAVAAGVAAWVGIPLACALWLRQAGPAWLLVPLVILWVQDMAAFFVGRAWGRRPLAPRISPGKTWEGALGGLAGALMAAVALAGPLGLTPTELLPAAAGAAVAGQLGDLWESWWKRRAGLKDSGSLLPGHGGMLDRIDSLLPALVLFAAWMRPWR